MSVKEYKILEFVNKNGLTGLDQNWIYRPNTDRYCISQEDELIGQGYTLNQMLYDGNCVNDGDIKISKVQQSNGDILTIGSKVWSKSLAKERIIYCFSFVEDIAYIQFDPGRDYWMIGNVKLVKEEQKEVKEVETVQSGEYSLDDIKIVLADILDKPELDQVLIDFKNYKRASEGVLPKEAELTVEAFKLPPRFFIKTPQHPGLTMTERGAILSWCINDLGYSFSNTNDTYCFNERVVVKSNHNGNGYPEVKVSDLINYINEKPRYNWNLMGTPMTKADITKTAFYDEEMDEIIQESIEEEHNESLGF